MIADLITGIEHLGLPTNDIEKTIAFYESLGFQVTLRSVFRGTDIPVAFMQLKDLVIETYENHRAAMQDGAINHVAMRVTDIESAFEQIKASGCTMIHDEIQFLPFWEKGVRFFTIRGVNNEKIEFSQIII